MGDLGTPKVVERFQSSDEYKLKKIDKKTWARRWSCPELIGKDKLVDENELKLVDKDIEKGLKTTSVQRK